MIQLKILSGKMAGASWVARRFPVRVGRAAGADLRSEEDGVWDEHLQLDFQPAEGVVLSTGEHALTAVNGQPASRVVLRNGDTIDLGSLRLQFWLAETRQIRLGWRECVIWSLLVLVTLGQVALIYWLIA